VIGWPTTSEQAEGEIVFPQIREKMKQEEYALFHFCFDFSSVPDGHHQFHVHDVAGAPG
jgi:hypothetical protein